MAPSNYIYTPLSSPHHIRILHLLPKSMDSQNSIKATLEEIPLYSGRFYNTLSYVWGPPTDPDEIIQVDGHTFRIKRNLFLALLELQPQPDAQPLVIWIDQICIDQTDLQERNSQVSMMGDIYRLSAKTIAWLGPQVDGGYDYTWIAALGKEAYEADVRQLSLEGFTNYLNGAWMEKELKDEKLVAVKDWVFRIMERYWASVDHRGFFDLGSREYFYRLWIMQECAMVAELVFRVEGLEMDSNWLESAVWFFMLLQRCMAVVIFQPGIEKLLIGIQDRAELYAENTHCLMDIYAVLGTRRTYLDHRPKTGGAEDLLWLLGKYHVQNRPGTRRLIGATDPKDRVFGLLGMARDANTLGIVPDYTKTVVEVYRDATRAFIEHGFINILCFAQPNRKVANLPSWVPDWSGFILDPICHISYSEWIYSAATSKNILIGTTADSNSISLHGVEVDTIKEIGNFLWDGNSGVSANNLQLQTFFAALKDFLAAAFKTQDKFPTIYTSSLRREEAIWRFPTGDKESQHGVFRRATDLSQKRYQINQEIMELVEWRPELADLGAHLEKLEEQGVVMSDSYRDEMLTKSNLMRNLRKDVGGVNYKSDMRILTNKRFYYTEKGYIGFGSIDIQKGDVVCLIFGANSPFVLRKVHEDQYILVGEAYCDGIMDGEFLESNPKGRMFDLTSIMVNCLYAYVNNNDFIMNID